MNQILFLECLNWACTLHGYIGNDFDDKTRESLRSHLEFGHGRTGFLIMIILPFLQYVIPEFDFACFQSDLLSRCSGIVKYEADWERDDKDMKTLCRNWMTDESK
jgi:hypothetical protein